MSDKDFNKKIRQKLYEHESDYDPKAWEKMKAVLPAPWYASFLQTYGGWLWGALASTALVFTLIYQNTKNNELYDEISTLKSQIAVATADSVFIEKTNTDTLYITQFVDQVVEVPVFIEAPKEKENLANANSTKEQSLKEASQGVPTSQNSRKNPFEKAVPRKDSNVSSLLDTETGNSEGDVSEGNVNESQEQSKVSSNSNSTEAITTNQPVDDEQIESVAVEIEESINENVTDTSSQEEAKDQEVAKTSSELEQSKELVKGESGEKAEVTEAIPTRKGKKLALPKMRLGVTSDYMGFNVLANGINAEVFIFDKLSINTSLIFSGLVETKHQLAADFNKKTGKDFKKEFERFNPRIPDRIKDISIQTSFVRLPINFNYYISTWSRFKFMVSAGTKLDLSVYQDIDFNSSLSSSPIRNRFEARPEPKVLNNINYGMGLEYQYRGFVGQLMPYFDFNFRSTDYFTPKRKFGIVGSLKYQLGK